MTKREPKKHGGGRAVGGSDTLATRRAGGRPPKHFAYDPKLIHGKRDQLRARAAEYGEKVLELWERMVRMGLRALDEGEKSPAGPNSEAALAGKRVVIERDTKGDETERTEYLPYAGLKWDDVMRASENIADRMGWARKSELDLGDDLGEKLWRLGTYKDKDGQRHELPRHPTGDTEPA